SRRLGGGCIAELPGDWLVRGRHRRPIALCAFSSIRCSQFVQRLQLRRLTLKTHRLSGEPISWASAADVSVGLYAHKYADRAVDRKRNRIAGQRAKHCCLPREKR